MFKDKLVELRKHNGDTQELLAKKLNISRSLVAKWEQGRAYPNEKDLDNIAKIYNIEIEQIMSSSELKRIYGIVKKSNKIKNILIIVLTMVSVIAISIAVVFGLDKQYPSYINEEKEFIEMSLMNYSNSSGNTNLVGKKEEKLLFSNEYGYAFDSVEIERYPFTDKSHLYFIHYHLDVTPGYSAYHNDLKKYNEDSILEEMDIKLNFDLNNGVSPIFAWPQKKIRMGIYNSKYSPIYIMENEIINRGLEIKKSQGIFYTYRPNIMYLIMDNTLSYQVKKIDTSNDDTLYKKWELTNIDDRTKTLSSGLNVYYLIEVKDVDYDIDNFKMYNEVVVNFSVKNKMYKVKQEIEYTLNFDY